LRTNFVRDYFLNETRTVSQPTLNIKQINETKVFLPSKSSQDKFELITQKVEKFRQNLFLAKNKSELFFQSLQQRAFAGELFDVPSREIDLLTNAATD
jgi:type I restriction enzyme S subunit